MNPDISSRLLNWFDRYGRHDLPWQTNRTAYRVWISEIMLQQTQVATAIPYFERFVTRFPSVKPLAAANIDDVLHLWSGLGYYARARNLHKAAQTIIISFNGKLPRTLAELQSLPGIGRSTAGAILACAYDQRAAILDGNVKRVLTRYHFIDGWPEQSAVKNKLWELADANTPMERSADYTQAIMDLGATICTRGKPNCLQCPLSTECEAYGRGQQQRLPAKKPRKMLPTKTTQMLIIHASSGEVLLEQRPPQGIWGGLWSLPECANDRDPRELCSRLTGCTPKVVWPGTGFRHTFSHFHLEITPVWMRVDRQHGIRDDDRLRWFNPDAVNTGVPAPVTKLLTTPAPARNR